MKTKSHTGFLPACLLLLLSLQLALSTQTTNAHPQSNIVFGSGSPPPQTGLRLWLKADAGAETNGSGQVTRWLDQSPSQAHAVLTPGSIGPLINNASDLGFTTIAFNGQTGALQLPPFMNGATAATAYIIVKSEKTNNPLWSMGDTTAGTLYPAMSGKIEDDFSSALVHTTWASTPPLYQWHAYQATSQNGAWWSALDQTLLPTKKNMAVQSYRWLWWPGDGYSGMPLPAFYCLWVQSPDSNSPLPALLPETGFVFEATVQAVTPSISNTYFGIYYIDIALEDGTCLGGSPYCEPYSNVPPYFKKTAYADGIARLTLTLDEIETFIGGSLHGQRIAYISLECESVILNPDGTYLDYMDFNINCDVKTNLVVDDTEIKNQFVFSNLPTIGKGFKGEIAEILIYDQNASTDESVNNYLSSKYGIFVADLHKDSDGDGIPDAWEIRNGLNPLDPSDALIEPNGDGTTWLQRYLNSLRPSSNSADLEMEIFSP